MYQKIIEAALKDLREAVKKMTAKTDPQTPLCRKREFIFAEDKNGHKIIWPYKDDFYKVSPGQDAWLYSLSMGSYQVNNLSYLVTNIIDIIGNQPRKILLALRRIQAATAWCEARAEGRKRQAEEIKRQQAKAIAALEAEAILSALK